MFFPDNYPLYPESDHYSLKSQRFFNPTPERALDKKATAQALWQMVFNAKQFAPESRLPMEKPDWQRFFTPNHYAQFIWLGHSSLIARIAQKTVLIDPVLAYYASPIPIMMKRFQPSPVALHELPEADLIIYSHNHYDHLDKAVVEHYRLQKTAFIVPLGMGVLLQKWGIEASRISELDWWQSLAVGELEITAVPARHNTGRGLFDSNKSLWTGYVFKTAFEQIYYSGDSAFIDGKHFEQIKQRFGHFDLAFVENGQYNLAWQDNHMLPEQTAQAIQILNPSRAMPVHWGAYPLSIHTWKEPVEKTIPLLKSLKIRPLTPLQGQVFDQKSETEQWWEQIN